MSDHLPECIYAPRNVDPKKGIEWGGQPCICPALRACEQRVLDAARERIMRLPYEIDDEILIDRDEVLAWIDHLREGND